MIGFVNYEFFKIRNIQGFLLCLKDAVESACRQFWAVDKETANFSSDTNGGDFQYCTWRFTCWIPFHPNPFLIVLKMTPAAWLLMQPVFYVQMELGTYRKLLFSGLLVLGCWGREKPVPFQKEVPWWLSLSGWLNLQHHFKSGTVAAQLLWTVLLKWRIPEMGVTAKDALAFRTTKSWDHWPEHFSSVAIIG